MAVTLANPKPTTPAQGKQRRTAPAMGRKILVPAKPVPVPFAVVMEGFPVPPRVVCDQCGATPGKAHAPDCTFTDWPLLIEGGEYRPTMAWALGAPAGSCLTCGAMGLAGWSDVSGLMHQETPAMVAQDRRLHKWWCSWWAAHPGVTPF